MPGKIDAAAEGKSFIIAKAGKPLVLVSALDAPAAGQRKRLGLMVGQIAIPDDFDTMGGAEVESLFSAPDPGRAI